MVRGPPGARTHTGPQQKGDITMTILTRAQREALYRIYIRPVNGTTRTGLRGYRSFRRMVSHDALMGCVMVQWAGMWLGIEPDGHTHS
jgi:hypothetical protein